MSLKELTEFRLILQFSKKNLKVRIETGMLCDCLYRIPSYLERRYQPFNLTPFIMIYSDNAGGVFSFMVQVSCLTYMHASTVRAGYDIKYVAWLEPAMLL